VGEAGGVALWLALLHYLSVDGWVT
jgi:hypothetical protein